MGLSKTSLFTDEQNRIAAMARAIAHPARIAIIQHLVRINSCVCGELVTETGLAQPTISQHLKELKNAGLIRGAISGTKVCYCLDPENWSLFRATFLDLFKDLPATSQCC
jgi:ArsR family transcriptional regulator